MYFAFLSFYMRSLIPASTLGIVSFFFLDAYSELYSISLLIWSVVFVEWWRIKERKLAVHWGVRGADAVETFRAEFRPDNDSWWKQELKMIASLPVIAIFGVLLVGLMTLIFVVESFLVLLYEGPGQDYAVGFELFVKSRFILIVSNSIALCSDDIVDCPRPEVTLLLSRLRYQAHGLGESFPAIILRPITYSQIIPPRCHRCLWWSCAVCFRVRSIRDANHGPRPIYPLKASRFRRRKSWGLVVQETAHVQNQRQWSARTDSHSEHDGRTASGPGLRIHRHGSSDQLR